MTKYQYTSACIPVMASVNDTDFDDALNEYGGAGWELVAYDFDTGVGIFKRARETCENHLREAWDQLFDVLSDPEVGRTTRPEPCTCCDGVVAIYNEEAAR